MRGDGMLKGTELVVVHDCSIRFAAAQGFVCQVCQHFVVFVGW